MAILIATIFFEKYLDEPRLTALNAFLVPFVIVTYISIGYCHFLFYYYRNCSHNESRITKVVLAIVPLILGLVIFGVSIHKGDALSDKATTLLSLGFSVLLAICWWLIRSEQAKIATKKNHTLNILLQSRISATYQERLAEASSLYTSDNYFPNLKEMGEEERKKYQRIIKYYGMMMKEGNITLPGNINFEVDRETVDIAVSLRGLVYLVNYFEFLAVGIEKDDIYEPLIEECLKGIALSLKKRAEHLIDHLRAKDSETWEYFLQMCSRWE